MARRMSAVHRASHASYANINIFLRVEGDYMSLQSPCHDEEGACNLFEIKIDGRNNDENY